MTKKNNLQNESTIKILKELNIELIKNASYNKDTDDDIIDIYTLNFIFENKIKEIMN